MTTHTKRFTGIIVQGQRVYSGLYGGRYGTIVSIHGEQSPASCQSLAGGVGVTGGSAKFDIIWDDGSQSRRTPETLIRMSVQWNISPDVATADEIIDLWERAELFTAHAKAQRDADAAQVEECRRGHAQDHPHLTQSSPENPNGSKLAAKNIRTELRRKFKDIKFSVRTDYDSVTIAWTDGPTVEHVKPFTDRHSSGTFDSYTDYAGWATNPFGQMFGECRYVWNNRTTSDEATEAVARDYCRINGTEFVSLYQTVGTDSLHTITRNILHHHSIPKGHHVTGCQRTVIKGGCIADYHTFYQITTAPTDPETVAKKSDAAKAPTFTPAGELSTFECQGWPRRFRSQATAQKAADAATKAGHPAEVIKTFAGRNPYAVRLRQPAN